MGYRLVCHDCNQPIYDSEPRRVCEGCEEIFCDFCGDNLKDGMTCAYCRKVCISDEDLLKFLLNHLKITRENVVELYRGNSLGLGPLGESSVTPSSTVKKSADKEFHGKR